MAYVEVSSAQLKALQELDRGHGLRIHGEVGAASRIDLFVNEREAFMPYAVSTAGETVELKVGNAPWGRSW